MPTGQLTQDGFINPDIHIQCILFVFYRYIHNLTTKQQKLGLKHQNYMNNTKDKLLETWTSWSCKTSPRTIQW